MLVCYNCGTPEKDEAGKCPHCGRTDFISEAAWNKKQRGSGSPESVIAHVAPHVAERLSRPLLAETVGAGQAAEAPAPAVSQAAVTAEPPVGGGLAADIKLLAGAALACAGLWLAFQAAANVSATMELAVRAAGGVLAAAGVALLGLGIFDTVRGGAVGRRRRVVLGGACAIAVLGLASFYIHPVPATLQGHHEGERSDEDAPTPPPRPDVEVLGNPEANVQVEAIVPGSQCFDPALEVVRSVAKEHPDDICVRLYAMEGPKAAELMEKYNSTCAGFFINGQMEYTIRDPDGTERTFYFGKSPGDEYTIDDLDQALRYALAQEGKGKADKASGGATR